MLKQQQKSKKSSETEIKSRGFWKIRDEFENFLKILKILGNLENLENF